MPQPPADPALELFMVGTLMLSIVACMNVMFMRRSGPVLPYEPRRPVPWGAIGSILAGILLVNMVYSLWVGGATGNSGSASQALTPWPLIAGMLQQLVFVAGFLFVIALFTKAKPRDFGLPTNIGQAVRDLCVGAAACLAALAPVHMLQQILLHLCFPNQLESEHPLIKMIREAPPDRGVLFLAGVQVVVVAPICEEIAFRLLLQGWLERWEDERLGWRRKPAIEMPIEQATTGGDEAATVSDKSTQPTTPSLAVEDSSLESEPPRRGIAGLPYGWFPILISSTAFGIAHFGYGPEPVPLFLLALVLGFLYQRTHRIVPSIIAHALFNLFTMIILWQIVYRHN